jgi:peptidoglycan/xylan/chitin deacetylase (PgdA/CDA1 family)
VSPFVCRPSPFSNRDLSQPPQGDVDDRIRYIAQQLGLDNVLWKFDAFDWKVASGQATPADVQANYDSLIADVGKGTFDTVRRSLSLFSVLLDGG